MVTACIDLGNSVRKAAVFNDSVLSAEFIFSDDLLRDGELFLNQFKPDRILLSSVTDHPESFEQLLSARSSFHKLFFFSAVSK